MLLVLFVLSLISPLLFLAGMLVLLGLYMTRIDKALIFFPGLSPHLSFLLQDNCTVLAVSSSGVMRAIVDVNESKGNAYALSALKSSNEPSALFSYGLALKRTGLYNEAIAAYNNLIKTKGDAPVYVNLGNVYVGQNNMEEAVKSYLAAINIRPLASAYYNLSQISREGLDFEKGNEYFSKALESPRCCYRISGNLADPNRIVADETISPSSLWNLAWKTPVKSATFNLSALPGWTISLAALLLIFAFYMMNNHSEQGGTRCRRCNQIASARAVKNILCGDRCAPNASGLS